MRTLLISIVLSIVLGGPLASRSRAEILTATMHIFSGDDIANSFCSAAVDSKNQLTIRSGGKILSRFELPITGNFHGSVAESRYPDPHFGYAKTLALYQIDGRQTSVKLWDKLPFVIIETCVTNDGKQPLIVKKIPIFETVLPEIAVDKLTVVGSGGPSKLGKPVESRLWLAAAEPASGHGIVAGFLPWKPGGFLGTSTPGTGIISAKVRDKHLQIRVQLEYDRLAIKPGETVWMEYLMIGYFDSVGAGLNAWADAIAKMNGDPSTPKSGKSDAANKRKEN